MARVVGRAVISAGHILVTGGRRGVGEAAARGAVAVCDEQGKNPLEWVFCLLPAGEAADFPLGRRLSAGQNKIERRILTVHSTTGAIVIGGGTGTADEVLLAVLEAIMNGYCLIPVVGTGGVADRICCRIPPFEEALLNDPRPSPERANALVKRLLSPPCWYCDIEPASAHEKWFETLDRDREAQRMHEIRHKHF
jgi:uncharacterized protein (TIGR00725 family)